MEINKRIDQLKKQNIFADLSLEDLELLAIHSEPLQFDVKHFICRKGYDARSVFLILSGNVSEYAVDGNEFTIMIKDGGKYDLFGELAVLLERPYFTSCIALSKVSALAINAHVFSRVMWQNKACIQEVLSVCINRLQRSAQKSISYTHFNAEGRLAYVLLMMHNEQSAKEPIRATQESLAERCGMTRQTGSSILNQWKRQGILEISRGRIKVLNEQALTDISLCCAKNY